MARPKNAMKLIDATDEVYAVANCPVCTRYATLDKDQFHGKVSIQCTKCDYHETHDLSKL